MAFTSARNSTKGGFKVQAMGLELEVMACEPVHRILKFIVNNVFIPEDFANQINSMYGFTKFVFKATYPDGENEYYKFSVDKAWGLHYICNGKRYLDKLGDYDSNKNLIEVFKNYLRDTQDLVFIKNYKVARTFYSYSEEEGDIEHIVECGSYTYGGSNSSINIAFADGSEDFYQDIVVRRYELRRVVEAIEARNYSDDAFTSEELPL